MASRALVCVHRMGGSKELKGAQRSDMHRPSGPQTLEPRNFLSSGALFAHSGKRAFLS